MNSYSDLLNQFESVSDELNNLILNFPSERREEIIFDKWSLKNVVSHLNHWMSHNINCIDALVHGKTPHWQPDTDKYNEEGVERRKNLEWEDIYSEFIFLKDKQILKYKNLPKELQEKKFWIDRRHTPLSFLDKDISHWRDEHIKVLNDFYKK